MLLSALIDGFLLDCKARRLSPDTIKKAYAPPLRELCAWLDDPQASEVTTADLREFVVHVSQSKRYERGAHPWMEPTDKPVSAWTVHRFTRVIKRLFNWAEAEGIVTPNPAATLGLPPTPKNRITIFSKDEIETLLAEAKAVSYRNYAIVFLFLDSGIRRGELCHLALDDVNVVTGKVTILQAKWDSRRAVRVGNACRKALWRYVAEHRKAKPGVDRFFVNRWGGPLTGNAVAQMLRRLGKRTGLHVHAHKFRHTFATMFALRTPNALLLADALGHQTLEMSRHYVHFAGTQSTDTDLSPMDWLLSE